MNCTVRAPEGIRASEHAVVTVVGGSLTARGAAVVASGEAKVSFDGAKVVGAIQKSGAAEVKLAASAPR